MFAFRSAQLFSAALAAVMACATAASAQTLDELYEKAKQEKSLVFYAGGPAAPHEARAAEFQRRFPGITVSITGGFSNVLNEKINQQIKAKKLETDMAFFQTVQDFVQWKREGVLAAYRPDGFEQVMPNLKDPDGSYMALSANAITYAWNTRLVKPEDAPKSALDFLKPVFAGKLISVYPQDDDAALYLFHLIVQKYGWSYMDGYMANKPNFIQGHLPVSRSVAEGTNAATLDATSSAWPFKRAVSRSRSRSRRSTRRRSSRSPAASSRMRRTRTPPGSISAGISPRSSRADSARSRRAPTCRHRRASGR
jgi:hypothetical protein